MEHNWKSYRFEELCRITRGGSPRPIHDFLVPAGIPWVKISDASESDSRFIQKTKFFIKPEGLSKTVQVHPGDLILSNSATPGIPKFMAIEACIHDGWLLLREFNGLDKDFAYYLLLHERPRIVSKGSGSVFTNLKTEILKKHEIKIPNITEQIRIASILKTFDEKLELNRRMNETLEAMARAIFKSWFVDFDPVRAKSEGRDTGLPNEISDLFPDSFVDSELGRIPKGWKVKPLKDQIKAVKGLSYKGAGLQTKGNGIPMHNLNSIYEGGGYKSEGIKYYDGEFKDRHLVEPGDLIMSNTEQGFDRLLIGYTALVPKYLGDSGIFSHHIFKISPLKSSPFTPQYLYYFFNNSRWHYWISGFSNGTTINMLPKDALEIPLIVEPDTVLIRMFSEFAKNTNDQIESKVAENVTLTALRDKLLPELISGNMELS